MTVLIPQHSFFLPTSAETSAYYTGAYLWLPESPISLNLGTHIPPIRSEKWDSVQSIFPRNLIWSDTNTALLILYQYVMSNFKRFNVLKGIFGRKKYIAKCFHLASSSLLHRPSSSENIFYMFSSAFHIMWTLGVSRGGLGPQIFINFKYFC